MAMGRKDLFLPSRRRHRLKRSRRANWAYWSSGARTVGASRGQVHSSLARAEQALGWGSLPRHTLGEWRFAWLAGVTARDREIQSQSLDGGSGDAFEQPWASLGILLSPWIGSRALAGASQREALRVFRGLERRPLDRVKRPYLIDGRLDQGGGGDRQSSEIIEQRSMISECRLDSFAAYANGLRFLFISPLFAGGMRARQSLRGFALSPRERVGEGDRGLQDGVSPGIQGSCGLMEPCFARQRSDGFGLRRSWG